jgi:mono/diheme cytochrome c family protein
MDSRSPRLLFKTSLMSLQNQIAMRVPRFFGNRTQILNTGSLFVWILGCFVVSPAVQSAEPIERVSASVSDQWQQLWDGMSPAAKRGYEHLTQSVYLPADFDAEVLKQLVDENRTPPFEDLSPQATSLERTFLEYGLAHRPENPSLPLQYVVTKDQRFVMNCFACHGGNLYGATYPGAANSMYALESLTERVRRSKIELGKPLSHMDMGSIFMPLGKTVGSSNAVMFGVALMNFRDAELNVHVDRSPAPMDHHDMDAPAWWHFHRKHHIYIDGFAEKGHKGLMQFMLVRQNGPEKFREWESDFRDVYEFIESLRPPKYPLEIDSDLAARGKAVFTTNCQSCHGSYGESGQYPELDIAIDDIGTNRVRFDALTPAHRQHYGSSWFADLGKQQTIAAPIGYVAPPLDGIWASAPYFHNGSVPTLWHLLHPEERPSIWRRTHIGFDAQKIGLKVDEYDSIPKRLKPWERRRYFDTREYGKSAAGHNYPDQLTETEKLELLEYLKTL